MKQNVFSKSQLERLKGRAILGVCASGVAAEARFAVDPEYRQRLHEAGAVVNQAYYEQITADLLSRHDLVFLVGFPKADAPEYIAMIEQDKAPLISDFVDKGGGLLVFVDDHYGRLFAPINRFLSAFGIEVLCEPLFDHNKDNNGVLPSSPEIATIRTTALAKDHPAMSGVQTVVLPNVWQAGVWPLKPSSTEWEVIVSGEATVETRLLWQEEVATWRESPPLCGVREYGKGRVVVLPVHSTFFLGNGMHRRWGGHFFKQDDNDLFLANLLVWASDKVAHQGTPRNLSFINEDQTMEWFLPVPPEKQPVKWPVHRGLVGVRSALSGGSHSVADLCKAAREAGFGWVAFVEREEEFPESHWAKLVEECERESSAAFSALPGVDFLARNDFDNRGIVVLPRYWPRKLENRRFIIQMIEEGGGFLIFSDPASSKIPAWNNGGFQGMEVVTYSGEGELLGQAFNLYERLQAHDWFQAPIARYHITTPEQIRLVGKKEGLFHTYAAAPTAGTIREALPKVEGMEYQEVFISSGPLIEEFWMEGPGMIKDIWEGRYYSWSLSPDEVMMLRCRVAASHPILDVQVWDDARICAGFYPGKTGFEVSLPRANDRRCRSYRLVVKDSAGREAWSTARRVRGSRFQAHGGGDRMNTYGSYFFPHPRGEFTMLGERCSASATMLFGLGWRQHQLNIYPPVATVDFHPEGGEWGAPAGRLERIHLNPVLQTVEGCEIVRPLESRLGFDLASHEVAVLYDRVEAFEKVNYSEALDGYIPYARPHLEKCSPALARHAETEFIRAELSYRFGRWRPEGGPVVMRMDVAIFIKKSLRIAASEELSLRILALETDLERYLQRLHFLNAESTHEEVAYPSSFSHFALGAGGYVAASEQPYGSFGIYQVCGEPLVARAGRVSGHCELELGWNFADGEVFPEGHVWKASLLLVVTGMPQGGQYFRDLYEGLWATGEHRWTFLQGLRRDSEAYPVRALTEEGAVVFRREDSRHLDECGVDELFEVSGLRENSSTLAFDRNTKVWHPLANFRGLAYWTLPSGHIEAVVGHPVISESASLEIQVIPEEGRLRVWIQNPTAQTVESEVRSNPAFTNLSDFSLTVCLPSGDSLETSIPLL